MTCLHLFFWMMCKLVISISIEIDQGATEDREKEIKNLIDDLFE
ncbi:hypothetical protein C2W64_01996 [Brevibacillus laterosporus]|nr:hypothetical protein C2W64_01996 [Brevibacillus laterosporus]